MGDRLVQPSQEDGEREDAGHASPSTAPDIGQEPHAFHSQYQYMPGVGRSQAEHQASKNKSNLQSLPSTYPPSMNMAHMVNALPATHYHQQPNYVTYSNPIGMPYVQNQTYVGQVQPIYAPYQPAPANGNMHPDSHHMHYAAQYMMMQQPTKWQQFQQPPVYPLLQQPLSPQHSIFPGSRHPLQHGQMQHVRMELRKPQAVRRLSMSAISSMPSGYNSPIQSSQLHAYLSEHQGDLSNEGGATAGSNVSINTANAIPRGPPRKPRQTGYALWVGNLPIGATVIDLKDHFSRGATKDIDSLKLISKSQCAFVNYKTADSCNAAMQRFHDSRFHGTRLVCRLRKSANEHAIETQHVPTSTASPGAPQDIPDDSEVASPDLPPSGGLKVLCDDQYFVLKSLTLDDLIMSTQSSLWATQPHNEAILNQAFDTARNVYLIFSVNKSGEYFGYGRMSTRIQATQTPRAVLCDEGDATELSTEALSSAALPTVPKLLTTDSSNSESSHFTFAPRKIPTASTEFAPSGHIIDDLARGTIFWEANTDEDVRADAMAPLDDVPPAAESLAPKESNSTSGSGRESQPDSSMYVEGAEQPSGKSFRVEWMSTNRLQFYKTRGLRNALNGNREVKIARDGTKIASEVGARLLGLFEGPNLSRREFLGEQG